jgi:hypothetical protein
MLWQFKLLYWFFMTGLFAIMAWTNFGFTYKFPLAWMEYCWIPNAIMSLGCLYFSIETIRERKFK